MSTTRASYIYRPNVPEFIQRQIQQLHEREARIVELEAELSQLQKDHAQLERDLEPYRVGSSSADVTIEPTAIETAPINRCPDEILCLIFENSVLIPHYHVFIRHLLVCRRWYTLVTNTAKLWARIEIFSPWDLFDIGSRKSLFPYIFACLNRSKNLPITADLDMRGLNPHNYIAATLAEHAKAIVDEDDRQAIDEHIQLQEWDFRSTRFDSQLETVIERLIGADRASIKRWRAMRLYFPYDEDTAIRVWNIMGGAINAVENVVLKNFPSESPIIFDLRMVKSFSLNGAEDTERCPITSFGLSPSTLEHLDIEVDNANIDLVDILHIRQLRTLRIFCSYYEADISFDFSISLPHLERLTLAGTYGNLARLRFDLPSLDLLRLVGPSTDSNRPLPAIHPRHVQASIPSRPSRVELKKVIRNYTLLSNVLESITINHPLERDDVKEVVAQSKLEGKASLLSQLIVEHENGEVERIRV